MQDRIRQIISDRSGQPYEKVARDTDRDYYLTSEQAVDYGLIDQVLISQPKGVKIGKDGKTPK